MNLNISFNGLKKAAAAVVLASVAFAPASVAQKNDYLFKRKVTPTEIKPYFTSLYMLQGKNVVDLLGTSFCEVNKPLRKLAVNPAGIDFIVIAQDPKSAEAALYSTAIVDVRLEKFASKKYGNPSAVAYTPDARQILLATDQGLHIIDAKTHKLLQTLPLDFIPTEMIMSSDNYYLACANDHNVTVYNFEERKPRKSWSFEETVNAMAFSEDNSEFGILTDDGLLNIYDTRSYGLKHSIEDLGQGLDFDFNVDGKYVAVAVAPDRIEIVNILRNNDREIIDVPGGNMSELVFIPDSNRNTLLANNTTNALAVKRITSMAPFYGKLIADEVAGRMNEWLKMAPGETMEQYRARVNDESRARQQRLFEGEISTQFADNLLSMSEVSLGKYDRANQMLEVDFDNMPSIFLPVPESEVVDFNSADDLEFTDAKYGIMPDDNFELIYAKIRHKGTGKSYIYDNIDRKPLSFLNDEDNVVSIEMLQQQQMEEMKLQELSRQVVEEAKSQNVITDHTNISVESRYEPSFDANGKKILNYIISFTYEVEPGFSVHEDFGPGKYHIDESGAAKAMLKIVKDAFEGDFAQYIKEGKKINIKISGTADGTPIVHGIPYDGVYGDFDNEIVYKDGQMTGISVNTKDLIKQNEQLAFLRAYGVCDFLTKNVANLKDMNTDYQYHISVAEGKGAEFRRITTEFTLVDVY